MSGKDMQKLFEQNGWIVLSQKGSHLKLGKDALRAIVPMHKELAKGTERALLKQLQKDGKTK